MINLLLLKQTVILKKPDQNTPQIVHLAASVGNTQIRWVQSNGLAMPGQPYPCVIAGHEFAFANAYQFPTYQLPTYQLPTYQRKETSLMKSNNLKHHLLIAMALTVLLVPAKINAAEPLKVFILAGQSNTVGHARAHTIATLYASDAARDKELIELVIDANSGISNATLEEQLVRGRKLDELTGGISNDKVKALSDGPEKTDLEAKVKVLKDQHEAYKTKIGSACTVSDRVYIN